MGKHGINLSEPKSELEGSRSIHFASAALSSSPLWCQPGEGGSREFL